MSLAEQSDWEGVEQQPVAPRPGGGQVERGGPGGECLLFNVGGTIYRINRDLIDRWPTALLAELMSKFDKGELKGTRLDGFNQDPPQPMYLDRHPTAFSGIAKFYLTKGEVLQQPWDISKDAWVAELRFFRVIGLGPTVDAAEAATHVLKQIGRPHGGHRRAMWDFLENPRSSCLAKSFMVVGLLVILVSILSLCLDTVYVLPHQARVFANLEAGCIIFFTLEYLARFYATDGKLRFVKATLNVIDLVAILPYYAGLLLAGGVDGLSVVRVVRLVRVFRVFKFGSSLRGLTVFRNTMVNSFDALVLLFFFVVLAILLFGSVIFFAERDDVRFDRPLYDGSARPRFCDHKSWQGCPSCTGGLLPECGGRQADIVDDKLIDGAYDGTRSTCEAVEGCTFIPAVEQSCAGVPSGATDAPDCHGNFIELMGPRSACVDGCTFVEAEPARCITEFEWHLASEEYASKPEETRFAELQAHPVHGAQCPTGEDFNASLLPPWDNSGLGSGDPIFTSIPMGFWWTLCTMTSLGYGEIYPVTYIGRVVGGLASLAGLITLALPMVIIGQNFSDAYRVQSMVEEAAADAEEALIARREARAKMKFEEKFRQIKTSAGLLKFRKTVVKKKDLTPQSNAGGGVELDSPRGSSESPTADKLEAALFPTPPPEVKDEQETVETDEVSSTVLDSLYPEQAVASEAAEVTPTLVPTPPPPRE